MVDVRCQCGKILCQHDAQVVIIKCRHCKRIINIGLKSTTKPPGERISPAAKYLITKPSAVSI